MHAVEAAGKNGKKDDLLAESLELVKSEKKSTDSTISISPTFLPLTVRTWTSSG